jgi:WD40 repeat protein
VWNVETGQDVVTVDAYDDTIYSVSWNRDGSLFASTCRDRQVRVIDPRQRNLAQVGNGHASTKSSRAAFTASPHLLLTTGFSKVCERQCALWDIVRIYQQMQSTKHD